MDGLDQCLMCKRFRPLKYLRRHNCCNDVWDCRAARRRRRVLLEGGRHPRKYRDELAREAPALAGV